MRMTIGKKLMTGFGILALIILLFGIFSVWTMGRIDVAATNMEKNWLPASIALGATDARTADFRALLFKHATAKDIAEKNKVFAEIQTALEDIKKNQQEYEATISTEKEKAMNAAWVKGWDEYKDLGLNKVIPLSNALKNTEAVNLLWEIKDLYQKFTNDIGETIAFNKQGGIDEAHKAEKTFRQAVMITVVVIIICILFAIIITIVLTRNITAPLQKLVAGANMVAKGDLTAEIEINTKDELEQLGDSFKEMTIGLKKVVSQVSQTAERVSSSSQELSATAQGMSATTEEVSSTVQQIAKGMEIQAQKVEETSKAMENMENSVKVVTDSAINAAAASQQTSKSAESGGKAVKEAVSKMFKIYEVATSSAGAVKKLGERSQEIDDIVNVITNIADQTNLLALNAAIEAARAGEAGRGFAVVADEVRKLAEGSAKAADQIGKLIREIKTDTEFAVKSMDEASKEVSTGREMIQNVDGALGEIIKNTESNVGMVQQIKDITVNQIAFTKQVVKAVEDIASTAEESAAATEEASASGEEMSASMQELAASAQELADMAVELKDLVGTFKTGRADGIPHAGDDRQTLAESARAKSAAA